MLWRYRDPENVLRKVSFSGHTQSTESLGNPVQAPAAFLQTVNFPEFVSQVLPPPVPAYENRIECQTLEELEQIKYNANALQMEGLAIRERILGPMNPEVPHSVTFRGAVFAGECLRLISR